MKIHLHAELEFNKSQRDQYVPTDAELAGLLASPSLRVSGASVVDLEPLRAFSALKDLTLSSLSGVKSIAPLADLKSLEELTLALNVPDYTVLESLPRLRNLVLEGSMTDLSFLRSLKSLARLWVNAPHLTSLTGLESLTNLEELHLVNPGVNDFAALSNLTKLNMLVIRRSNLVSLMPMNGMRALRELYIENAPLTDLAGVEALSTLQRLELSSCRVDAIDALASLTHLEFLNLLHTPVKKLGSLYALKNLKQIQVSETAIAKSEMQAFQKAMPHCSILTEKGAFPFRTFETYRVKKSFTNRGSEFREGQILLYADSQTNHYDGIEIIYFTDKDTRQELRWDINQYDLDQWTQFIERIPPE